MTEHAFDDFERQAGQAGFPVERSAVYRLDGRPPRAVWEAGGFLPNPGKPPLGMAEHVAPGSTGGSCFVSTCLRAGNPYNLRNSDFITDHVLRGPTDAQANAWIRGTATRGVSVLYQVFEYEIDGVLAARVLVGGVPGEEEALIARAPRENITRVRPVFVRQAAIRSEDGETGTWARLKAATVRIGSWRPFAGTALRSVGAGFSLALTPLGILADAKDARDPRRVREIADAVLRGEVILESLFLSPLYKPVKVEVEKKLYGFSYAELLEPI